MRTPSRVFVLPVIAAAVLGMVVALAWHNRPLDRADWLATLVNLEKAQAESDNCPAIHDLLLASRRAQAPDADLHALRLAVAGTCVVSWKPSKEKFAQQISEELAHAEIRSRFDRTFHSEWRFAYGFPTALAFAARNSIRPGVAMRRLQTWLHCAQGDVFGHPIDHLAINLAVRKAEGGEPSPRERQLLTRRGWCADTLMRIAQSLDVCVETPSCERDRKSILISAHDFGSVAARLALALDYSDNAEKMVSTVVSLATVSNYGPAQLVLAKWFWNGAYVNRSPAKAYYFASAAEERGQDAHAISVSARSQMTEAEVAHADELLDFQRKSGLHAWKELADASTPAS